MARWTGTLIAGMLLVTALAPAAQAHWSVDITQTAGCGRGDTSNDFKAVATANARIWKKHEGHVPADLIAKAEASAGHLYDHDSDVAWAADPTDTYAEAYADIDGRVPENSVARADGEVEAKPIALTSGQVEDPPEATANCQDAGTAINAPGLPSIPGISIGWNVDASNCTVEVTVNGVGVEAVSIVCHEE